jgi:cytochrome c peroxidase
MRLLWGAVTFATIASGIATARAGDLVFPTTQKLGEALFSDTNLSKNRTMACSTCHMPDMGLTDHRKNDAGMAVSRGDEGKSLGDREAPSAAYAAFNPPFHRDDEGNYVGGNFWDGRASTLEDQAGGPPLNPVEMGMTDKASVEARIRENKDYVAAFKAFYGDSVFDKEGDAYAALTKAIASYERTPALSTFDSRYDRYLKGEVKFTDQEELGRTLFFSTQFASCSQCHDLKGPDGRFESSTFTSYKYFNIGVPENAAVRKLNGKQETYVDTGLGQNPLIKEDPKQIGKFKVPTLRNVAVTGPYMHNGVFKDLRTVILFYNKYNSKKKSRQINPETGQRWADPEVKDNLALEKLQVGPGMDDKRVDALVAFLKTLTDKRYEDQISK